MRSAMNTQENKGKQQLKELKSKINDLKKLVTNLTEAAERSKNKEISWVYAMEGNRDGVWDWNAVTGKVFFSTRWKKMLGFDEDEIANELSEWESRIHPEDKADVYSDLNAHLEGQTPYYENEHRLLCKDGSYKWILDRGKILSWTDEGSPLRVVGTHTDISSKKAVELENQRLMKELQEALDNVRILSGFLPICASCKKIRDDQGKWNHIENYIRDHSEAQFSHSICPDCSAELYPELTALKKK